MMIATQAYHAGLQRGQIRPPSTVLSRFAVLAALRVLRRLLGTLESGPPIPPVGTDP